MQQIVIYATAVMPEQALSLPVEKAAHLIEIMPTLFYSKHLFGHRIGLLPLLLLEYRDRLR